MIEIVYNKEKETATGNEEYFCIPRNIRQIGRVPSNNRIYIEDYAYGYLSSYEKEKEKKGNAAILLGKCNWKEGVSYIFAKSALFMTDLEITAEHISITDAVWGNIYEEMKEYFPGQEVVGWYLSLPGNAMKITEVIYRAHLNHFGGNDKVLFLADPDEQEEAFFLYRNGHLEKQDGYYIYYEKNTPMQQYMLRKKPKESVDGIGKVQDRAVKDFRKIIARKNEEKESKKNNQFLYIAGTGVVALSLALGVTFVSRKMNLKIPSDSYSQETLSETETGSNSVSGQVAESAETGTESLEISSITQEHEDTQETSGTTQKSRNTQEASGITQKNGDTQETSGTTGEAEDSKETSGLASDTRKNADTSESSTETSGTLSESARNSESKENSDADTASSANASGVTRYTIREGDTLTSISIDYYGDIQKVKEICKLNDLKEDDIIYPGQIILLP